VTDKVEWVYTLKFIGIIAVILGHISSPLGEFIFSWHMPLFFVLSGFFIRLELDPLQVFNKEIKRLIIPYFIFVVLALVVETSKRVILHRAPLDFLNELNGAFFWMDMDGLINSYAFILWFLPALFVSRYLTYAIKKYIKHVVLQTAVVVTLFLISFKVQLPFAIDNGLNALLFVYVGHHLLLLVSKRFFLILSLVITIGVYFVSGIPSLNMSEKQYSDILLNLVWSISVVCLLISIIAHTKNVPKIVMLWGGNTMLLFIFHPYTNNISSIIVDRVMGGEWYFKLLLSIVLLQTLMFLKSQFSHWRLFKYV